MDPYHETGNIRVYHGSCEEVLAALDLSVSAVVTDPPYGLAFMGRDWDDFEPREYQRFCEGWAASVQESMRPGAPLLAFSGTRTFHRAICGIEDAGFTVKDCLSWTYGQGFPKSHDISKGLDKMRDDEEEMRVLCRWLRDKINQSSFTTTEIAGEFGFSTRMVEHWAARDTDSQPSTPKLEQWRQLKSLLGFSDEMDPLVNWLNDRKGEPAQSWDEREVIETLEDNANRSVDILQGASGEYQKTAPATGEAERWDGYGTALAPSWEPICYATNPREGTYAENALSCGVAGLNIDGGRVETDGERPNREHDRTPGFADVGVSGGSKADGTTTQGRWPANVVLDEVAAEGLDASRYFYTSKASSSDRNAGLPDGRENDWPTVKPTDLMGWLLRLVEMPSDNLILDPFAGSGTTAYVAQQMGLPCVAIDQSEEACELTKERLSTPSLFS